jgi:hypothetical protein
VTIRFLWPGIVVYLILLVIFIIPTHQTNFDEVKFTFSSWMFKFISFSVFSHVWLTGLMKQRKLTWFKKNAFAFVLGMIIFTALLIELMLSLVYNCSLGFSFARIFSGILGGIAGFLSFHLLYKDCY